MPDILSQGEGRSYGPWPRRVAVVAALVLVAVLIVHYLPRSQHEARRPARAAVTAAPVPPPCAARCRLQVLNLTTGAQTSAGLPAASSVASAAFSPDGSLLVVQVGFSDNTANGVRAVQLEQVSLASGRHLTAVPQTWVSSDALVGFGWAAGGDSLVAEFSFTTKVQLASWRPGASRLAIVAFEPRHSPAALVIGRHVP